MHQYQEHRPLQLLGTNHPAHCLSKDASGIAAAAEVEQSLQHAFFQPEAVCTSALEQQSTPLETLQERKLPEQEQCTLQEEELACSRTAGAADCPVEEMQHIAAAVGLALKAPRN